MHGNVDPIHNPLRNQTFAVNTITILRRTNTVKSVSVPNLRHWNLKIMNIILEIVLRGSMVVIRILYFSNIAHITPENQTKTIVLVLNMLM